MREKIAFFFKKKSVKKIFILLGLAFAVLTFFIILKPDPFIKYGYPGIFIFNLFGPGTFLIPELSRHFNVVLLSAVTALAMGLNDSVSWTVGRYGNELITRSPKAIKIEENLKKLGPLALFFWSLIPFPYDIIGLIAGYMRFSYVSFIIPTFLGKFVRFLLIGTGTLAILGKYNF